MHRQSYIMELMMCLNPMDWKVLNAQWSSLWWSISGAQAHLHIKHPKIVYLLCSAHEQYLVLRHILRAFPDATDLFETLESAFSLQHFSCESSDVHWHAENSGLAGEWNCSAVQNSMSMPAAFSKCFNGQYNGVLEVPGRDCNIYSSWAVIKTLQTSQCLLACAVMMSTREGLCKYFLGEKCGNAGTSNTKMLSSNNEFNGEWCGRPAWD